jgi:hypothetical protein
LDHVIKFHEPHPSPEVHRYVVRDVRQKLEDKGLI